MGKKYENVTAKPVKGFFVEMLTRDISLHDAILDLLDNCVDGILRFSTKNKKSKKPYDGFFAEITITSEKFEIRDNCGGIPWSEHDRAFRMGRPPDQKGAKKTNPMTVGVYGIGMKRAIFKMGRTSTIWTQNDDDAYKIDITDKWLKDENNWDLNVLAVEEKMDSSGTVISISDLYEDVKDHFSAEVFSKDLLEIIQSHYSVILQKGFSVKVNGIDAIPRIFAVRYAKIEQDGNLIRPYIFSTRYKYVDVFITVGLREPIPDSEKLLSEQETPQYSTDDAGLTVICNDRVVLFCNKDEMTGWGTADIPRYHTQFIAVSGIVEFNGDPRDLPMNTTKRGLDFSSAIYQQSLNRVRDGLRIFINFTNKWKTREEQARKIISDTPSISYSELRENINNKQIQFSRTRSGLIGDLYQPHLPTPAIESADVRISFSREKNQVSDLADKLLDSTNTFRESEIPRRVGEAAFDFAYKKLVKDITEHEN